MVGLSILQTLVLAVALWLARRQFAQGRRYELLKLGEGLMALRETYKDDQMLALAMLRMVDRHVKELS